MMMMLMSFAACPRTTLYDHLRSSKHNNNSNILITCVCTHALFLLCTHVVNDTHSHSRRVCVHIFASSLFYFIHFKINFFSIFFNSWEVWKMRQYIFKIGRKHSIERISKFFLFGVILIISKRNLHLFSINSIQVPSACIRARRSYHNKNWIINASFFWLAAPSFLNGQTLFVLFHTN